MLKLTGKLESNAAEIIAGVGSADILPMGGRSRVSRTIKVGTCSSASHIAGVSRVSRLLLGQLWELRQLPNLPAVPAEWTDGPKLFESTTLCTDPCLLMGTPVRGVQVHDIASRIEAYDGKVWVCKLNPDFALSQAEEERLSTYLLRQVGKGYDDRGAVMSVAGDLISRTRLIKYLIGWRADLNKVFCDALWGNALSAVNRFGFENSGRYNPGTFVQKLIEVGKYLEPVRVK